MINFDDYQFARTKNRGYSTLFKFENYYLQDIFKLCEKITESPLIKSFCEDMSRFYLYLTFKTDETVEILGQLYQIITYDRSNRYHDPDYENKVEILEKIDNNSKNALKILLDRIEWCRASKLLPIEFDLFKHNITYRRKIITLVFENVSTFSIKIYFKKRAFSQRIKLFKKLMNFFCDFNSFDEFFQTLLVSENLQKNLRENLFYDFFMNLNLIIYLNLNAYKNWLYERHEEEKLYRLDRRLEEINECVVSHT